MTVQRGKIKWHRFAAAAIPSKHAEMADNFKADLEAQGVKVGPQTLASYRRGTRQAGGSQTDNDQRLGKVARDSDKWERNYLKAMGR